jgi:hypothetical protein
MRYKKKEYGFNIVTERFTKVDNGTTRYIEDAVILQAILYYSKVKGNEKYFTRKEITDDHLFKYTKPGEQKSQPHTVFNNMFDGDKKRTKDDSKKAHIKKTIIPHLVKLVYLGLIESKGYECSNDENSIKYRFTKFGRMIGLLLLYKENKTLDIYKETYNQMIEYYHSLKHTHAEFCVVFFSYTYQINLLDQVMFSILDLLYNASDDKSLFLNQINFLDVVYRNSELWEAFKESIEILDEMNYNSYELFLLNLKLTLEEVEESKSKRFKDYEVMRLEKSKDIDTVVLEGYCFNCKAFYIISMKTMEYLDDYIKSYVSGRHLSYVECPKCKQTCLNFKAVIDYPSIS